MLVIFESRGFRKNLYALSSIFPIVTVITKRQKDYIVITKIVNFNDCLEIGDILKNWHRVSYYFGIF